jgi:hypothetical protein
MRLWVERAKTTRFITMPLISTWGAMYHFILSVSPIHRFLFLETHPDIVDWEERKTQQAIAHYRPCESQIAPFSKLLFRAPGNPGDVRLDNVIDPVLSDKHWLNPCKPV